jgi:hypothetical protein
MKSAIERLPKWRELSLLKKVGAVAATTALLGVAGAGVFAERGSESADAVTAKQSKDYTNALNYELSHTFEGTVKGTGVKIDSVTVSSKETENGRGSVYLHIDGADINHKVYDDDSMPHYTLNKNPTEVAIGPQGQRTNGLITWSDRAHDVAEMHPWLNFAGKTPTTHTYELSLAAYGERLDNTCSVARYELGNVAITGSNDHITSAKLVPSEETFTLEHMNYVPREVMVGGTTQAD